MEITHVVTRRFIVFFVYFINREIHTARLLRFYSILHSINQQIVTSRKLNHSGIWLIASASLCCASTPLCYNASTGILSPNQYYFNMKRTLQLFGALALLFLSTAAFAQTPAEIKNENTQNRQETRNTNTQDRQTTSNANAVERQQTAKTNYDARQDVKSDGVVTEEEVKNTAAGNAQNRRASAENNAANRQSTAKQNSQRRQTTAKTNAANRPGGH